MPDLTTQLSKFLASLYAGSMTLGGSSTKLVAPSDGALTLSNNAGTDFTLLQFGGVSASFPALKRSTTTLQARLADDSGFASFQCNAIIVTNAASPLRSSASLTDAAAAQVGTLTNAPIAGNPTKWFNFDDNGTTRRIPMW